MNYVFLERHNGVCYSLCASTKHESPDQALEEAKSFGRGGEIIQLEGNFKYSLDKVVGIETNAGGELFKNEDGFFDWDDVKLLIDQATFFEATICIAFVSISKVSVKLINQLDGTAPLYTDERGGEHIYRVDDLLEDFESETPELGISPEVAEELRAIKVKMDAEGCDFLRIVKG